MRKGRSDDVYANDTSTLAGGGWVGAILPEHGEVVEWLMAPASKADERDERSESSNLSLSKAKDPSDLMFDGSFL